MCCRLYFFYIAIVFPGILPHDPGVMRNTIFLCKMVSQHGAFATPETKYSRYSCFLINFFQSFYDLFPQKEFGNASFVPAAKCNDSITVPGVFTGVKGILKTKDDQLNIGK